MSTTCWCHVIVFPSTSACVGDVFNYIKDNLDMSPGVSDILVFFGVKVQCVDDVSVGDVLVSDSYWAPMVAPGRVSIRSGFIYLLIFFSSHNYDF